MHNKPESSIDKDSNDGWTLYYSNEGYPYYYNCHTGQSVWAKSSFTAENVENNEEYIETNGTNVATMFEPSDTDDNEDVDKSDDSISDSIVSDISDDAFQEYLSTHEGSEAFKVSN